MPIAIDPAIKARVKVIQKNLANDPKFYDAEVAKGEGEMGQIRDILHKFIHDNKNYDIVADIKLLPIDLQILTLGVMKRHVDMIVILNWIKDLPIKEQKTGGLLRTLAPI